MAGNVPAALTAVTNATLSPAVIKAAGAGKAYQSVAQSSAIAIQDGTDYLRNITSLCTATFAVWMIRFVKEKNPAYLQFAQDSLKPIDTATTQYTKIAQAATQVVSGFPSG